MTVVAIVPAKDRADAVGATVRGLFEVPEVDRILVVDDGSHDTTAEEARAAGATVLRLPENRGKAAAVAAGVAASPDADVFLLVDADVGATSSATARLLELVLDDRADLVVGVLPTGERRRHGLGTVRRLAEAGIHRAGGIRVRAPLSGQRAVRASCLPELAAVERFGLEVAMTIDAVRAGARLREMEVPMQHRATGRTLRGFAHRGRQGLDVVRALWPRVTSARLRTRATALALVMLLGGLVWSGRSQVAASQPAPRGAAQVVLVGVPHLGLDDLGTGTMPHLDWLVQNGAAAATNVRTLSTRPSSAEAYATLGAGNRVMATIDAAVALPAVGSAGGVVLPGMPAVRRDAGEHVSTWPGTLGDALAQAGRRTAVVSNADSIAADGRPVTYRPAAAAVADSEGVIGAGQVDPAELLVPDPVEPFGLRADVDAYLAATDQALEQADLVVVDLGDMNRLAWQTAASSVPASSSASPDSVSSVAPAPSVLAPPIPPPAEVTAATRARALGRVDDYLGRLVAGLDGDTMLLVVGVRPPSWVWELTPTVAYGAGVEPGSLYSPSTKREGLVTLTDLAPTVLDALGAPQPAGMVGSPLRYRAEPFDHAASQRLNDLAGSRERVYRPMAVTFVVVQALVYLGAVVALARGRRRSDQTANRRVGRMVRLAALTFAAWPLATFLERAVPGIERLGGLRHAVVWVMAAAVAGLAARARRHPLAPLSWIAAATALVLVVDVAAGAELQMASILGYSPHTAARYIGFGNTAFAVLAACAVVLAAAHVAYAPRRGEAVVSAAALLAVVLFADVWPTLGADVGGVLTMVPVFGLLLVALSGRRVSWRQVLLLAGATAAVLALVTVVDLLRPVEDRSHLARFASAVVDGDGRVWTTIERKWSTNVRLFGRTVWTWMVPLTAGFMLYVLVIARGWQRLLPAGSALRAGAVATIAAGLLGWLVNDSGVVVSGLVFVFVGPYLTLLALHDRDAAPVLLPPTQPTRASR